MKPVDPASPGLQQATKVEMMVATTRLPSGSPATLFSGERGTGLSLTDVAVSIPKSRAQGAVQWPSKLPPDPAKDFAIQQVSDVTTPQQAKVWFKKNQEGGKALVFIHGFNNTYEDAVFRFAQITHDSQMKAAPILFTWPSRASVTAYEYDKESANFSRTALEDTLQTMDRDPSVKEITVLAHSMGTWLAMEALRQMGIRHGHVSKKIKAVILASPDIDIDVFAKQFVEMGEPRPHFTIFVSQDDKALATSNILAGRVGRLGRINPAEEPYRSRLEAAGITAIDLTKVKAGDGLDHGKFAASPEIVQLIGQRLIDGQKLTDSQISLNEGIANVVGGAVGAVGNVVSTAIATPTSLVATAPKPSTQVLDSIDPKRPVASGKARTAK